MMRRRALVWLLCGLGVLASADVASAQYGVRRAGSGGAVGEDYHIELGMNFWNPDPAIVVSSESIKIPGSTIDGVNDLGFAKERFQDFNLILRPSRKFKFRFGYTPIRYQSEAILQRRIVFNGQAYNVGLPVNSDFDWKAWRFGLEYDFIYGSRGFVGFIAEAKYTNLDLSLTSPVVGYEFTKVKVPVPTIGGIGRVYVARNVSITGELTGLKISYQDDEGKYIETNIYGMVNITNNVGARLGYRRVDVDYVVDLDSGDLKLDGIYFGGVVRF
jgi:hypothetical protein